MLETTKLKERSTVKHVKIKDFVELEIDYIIKEEIGRGSFGVVIAVTEKRTHKNWAMKIIYKTTNNIKMRMVQREMNILEIVEHPHIIFLEKVFECSKKIYLVLERCFGELFVYYRERKPFPVEDTRTVVRSLASAVNYLHYNNIVHRDLKLENILLAVDPKKKLLVKIADFGLSVIKTGFGVESMLHDTCGTPTYMSPEMIMYRSYSHQTDIWSLGVLMYVLLYDEFPFMAEYEQELRNLICNADPSFDAFKIAPEAKDLVKKMLTKNPAERLTAAEILQHPWIVGVSMDKAPKMQNVLDMMKEWSDLKVPGEGEESDWVLPASSSKPGNVKSGKKSSTPGPSRKS